MELSENRCEDLVHVYSYMQAYTEFNSQVNEPLTTSATPIAPAGDLNAALQYAGCSRIESQCFKTWRVH